jgi:hypothetical protein
MIVSQSEVNAFRELLYLLSSAVLVMAVWLAWFYYELQDERRRNSKLFLSADERQRKQVMNSIEQYCNSDLMTGHDTEKI